ncbi:M1 family metallopeptidase [Mongoliitalea daihaiensis]|uniref:M1 family metallopeptidase n=1 Tax=Mongoliitalea daihaiensis TaxID=2782006 RepID=UPI001F35C229|nr:M1 family metallopeptidase [Mongoliitalea daihaiensis]UJP66819.1 M1 family metallopeptidase [Mongoliitalea daihaiensis]
MKTDYSKLFILVFVIFLSACKSVKQESQSSISVIEVGENEFLVPKISSQLAGSWEKKIEGYRATDTRYFDLLHTMLDLRFDFTNMQVIGTAELLMKPYFYEQKEVVLDAKDFHIYRVDLLEDGEVIPLNYRYKENKLTAYLPRVVHDTDTLRLKIKYIANPNDNNQAGSRAITDTKGLYFINPLGNESKPIQVWTQGETAHNSKWFPTFDSPNERMTQEIKLTVPKEFRTLSNGILQSSEVTEEGMRTDHWLMDKPHAPYLAAMVVGEFAEIQDEWKGMQVNYYVEPTFETGAKEVFKNTPEMIEFFSNLLGVDYPWQQYNQVVVRDFVSGAMENTTLSIFMEDLNLTEREAIDSEWDGIIAHELFHQWFGNLVTTESWANLTLNEAFANYSEYLWYEYKLGRDEANMHHVAEMEKYFGEAEEKQEDLIRFYYDDPEDMFDNHSYAKGGRVLHMLRRHLGDRAFFASLQHYLIKHAYSAVEIHDLRLAFEEVTGMDLNWFFNPWFLASGHPLIAYEVDYSIPDNLLLTIEQKQDLTNTPLYRIPFKVSWYHEGERYEKDLVLDKAFQQFAIENGVPVNQLYLDEEKVLLKKTVTTRPKEFFIKQLQESEFAIARYEALDSLMTYFPNELRLPSLAANTLEDTFWANRELAIMFFAKEPTLVPAGLEDKIYDLADSDSQNTVRLAAIELLGLLDGEKYAPAMLRWMNDPSYYVAAAALGTYLAEETNTNRKEIAERYTSDANVRMTVALAEYFIQESILGKSEWFHERLDAYNRRSLYYFIGYYGEYFTKLPEEGMEKAIERLTKIAKSEEPFYIKIAAFSALFGFVDQPGVLDSLKQMYELETDESVKRYQEYFLIQYLD